MIFGFLVATATVVRGISFGWALAVGEVLGRLAHRLDASRAQLAARQIARALSVDEAAARRLARDVYAHFGKWLVEVMRLPVSRDCLEDWVHLPTLDAARLQGAVDEGKGVILVTGHIGNWELMAHRLAAAGFDGVVVERPLRNPYLGRWLATRRAASGLGVIERGRPNAALLMLRALRRGTVLGLLIDQRTEVASVQVPFFGRSAPTPVAAAALALRGERPVVVATIRRRSNGRHEIKVERVPLPSAGGRVERRLQLTRTLTHLLETAIRRDPDQWTWIHERWSPEKGETPSSRRRKRE